MARRWLAVLPVLFYIHVAVHYTATGWQQALWICHVSCLVMAIGLVANRARWVWVAALWQLVGTPFWLLDGILVGDWKLHSIGVHFICPIIGLYALRGVATPSHRVLAASVYFLGLQAVCRAFTPAAFNLNQSHHVVPWMSTYIHAYPVFWVVNFLLFLVVLLGVDRLMQRLRPS